MYAVLEGRPAIDGGKGSLASYPAEYDHGGPGYQRIVGDAIDIGAYEYGAGPSDTQLRPWLDLAVLLAVTGSGAVLPWRPCCVPVAGSTAITVMTERRRATFRDQARCTFGRTV